MINTENLAIVSPFNEVSIVKSAHAEHSGQQIEAKGAFYIFLSDFSTLVSLLYVPVERRAKADDNVDEPYRIDDDFVRLGFSEHGNDVGACRVGN